MYRWTALKQKCNFFDFLLNKHRVGANSFTKNEALRGNLKVNIQGDFDYKQPMIQ